MAQIDIGKLKPTWKSAYNNSTAYVVDDMVSYQNQSYICKLASTGNVPTNTTYWDLIAAKGTDADLAAISGTVQGDLYYNNGSAIARLAPGTSGQVLQTGGSGANPSWVNGGGGQVSFVTRTAITSSVASVAFTNLEANNYHRFVFQSVDSTNNGGEDFAARISVDNGSSWVTSTYRFCFWQFYDSGSNNTTGSGGGSSTGDKWRFADGFSTSGTDEGLHGEFTLYNVGNGQRPAFMSQTTHRADTTNRQRGTVAGGFIESAQTANAIQFFFDSGNINGSSYAFITHYKGVLS